MDMRSKSCKHPSVADTPKSIASSNFFEKPELGDNKIGQHLPDVDPSETKSFIKYDPTITLSYHTDSDDLSP